MSRRQINILIRYLSETKYATKLRSLDPEPLSTLIKNTEVQIMMVLEKKSVGEFTYCSCVLEGTVEGSIEGSVEGVA